MEPENECEDCGRRYLSPGQLFAHQRNACKKHKRSFQVLLSQARAYWEAKTPNKRRRLDPGLPAASVSEPPRQQAPFSQVNPNVGLEVNTTSESIVTTEDLPPVPPAGSLARPTRNRRLPARFRDDVAEPPPLTPSVNAIDTVASASDAMPLDQSPNIGASSFKLLSTPCNIFGTSRRYNARSFPSHDPEASLTVEDLYTSEHDSHLKATSMSPSSQPYYPYPNESSFKLGDWYWSLNKGLSLHDFKNLTHIIGDESFSPSHIRDTAWPSIDRVLGSNREECDEDEGLWFDDEGWLKTTIKIDVPFHGRWKTRGVSEYIVGELLHRSIVSVIKDKLSTPNGHRHFHYEPFELLWKRRNATSEVRIRSELYNSDAFLQAHQELQNSPSEIDCNLQRVIVALMFWSDATNLTSFGHAQLWPVYLFFGNESKYVRSKPTSNSCYHIAYFETLSDSFKDFLTAQTGGKLPSATFMAHCKREVFHAQWSILLDDELVNAMKHGLVLKCHDGLERRFYPRIFTYSADYPEKVLIATIRNLGGCPCPRCLIPKAELAAMGIKADMKSRQTELRAADNTWKKSVAEARSLIYNENNAIGNDNVERKLKPQLLVPTINSFACRLADINFDVFSIIVVDLMHEFELGVWKTLFTHLIRILDASDTSLIHEMDLRYRSTPTFGRAIIRKFDSNVSELKRLAARDFEDILQVEYFFWLKNAPNIACQCAIPVFEGLLPEPYNSIILKLLFLCAQWHGLAKLRSHSDDTLQALEGVTRILAATFRQFTRTVCPDFSTYELQREADARARHAVAREKKGKGKAPAKGFTSRRPKTFNLLNTIKYHFLGDYVDMIKKFGTTDSYTTERGEQEHQLPKYWYQNRTNKTNFRIQIARIERQRMRLRKIRKRLSRPTYQPTQDPEVAAEQADAARMPKIHHYISRFQKQPLDLAVFLRNLTGVPDPALLGFLPKLKHHLLPRVKQSLMDDDPDLRLPLHADGDWLSVVFKEDRIFDHKIMRIKFTTYDVRREEDVIHTGTSHCNIMGLNPKFQPDKVNCGEHPFWYAQVLGIYHVNVSFIGNGTPRDKFYHIEFLWVRWYDIITGYRSGGGYTLDRLSFPPMKAEDSFGFLDPTEVIRATHIIPRFVLGKVHSDERGLSAKAKDYRDWNQYVVNRFVDRDMMMRYEWGQGIGHTYSHTTKPTVTLSPPDEVIEGDDKTMLAIASSLNVTEPMQVCEDSDPEELHEDNHEVGMVIEPHINEDMDMSEEQDRVDGWEDGEDEDADTVDVQHEEGIASMYSSH